MGGVINIVTRRTKGPAAQTQLGVKLGSFDLREISGARSWHQSDNRINLRASALNAENDFPFTYDAGTPDVQQDDREQRRNNADYERYSGALDITRQSGIHQYHASLQGQWSRKALPAWNNNDVQDTHYRKRTLGASLAWSATGMADGRADQSVRYRTYRDAGHLNDPTSVIGLHKNDSYDTEVGHRLQHLGAWYWGMHISTLVNEVSHSRLSFEDRIRDREYQYDEW